MSVGTAADWARRTAGPAGISGCSRLSARTARRGVGLEPRAPSARPPGGAVSSRRQKQREADVELHERAARMLRASSAERASVPSGQRANAAPTAASSESGSSARTCSNACESRSLLPVLVEARRRSEGAATASSRTRHSRARAEVPPGAARLRGGRRRFCRRVRSRRPPPRSPAAARTRRATRCVDARAGRHRARSVALRESVPGYRYWRSLYS